MKASLQSCACDAAQRRLDEPRLDGAYDLEKNQTSGNQTSGKYDLENNQTSPRRVSRPLTPRVFRASLITITPIQKPRHPPAAGLHPRPRPCLPDPAWPRSCRPAHANIGFGSITVRLLSARAQPIQADDPAPRLPRQPARPARTHSYSGPVFRTRSGADQTEIAAAG